jgi:hypothetical protein
MFSVLLLHQATVKQTQAVAPGFAPRPHHLKDVIVYHHSIQASGERLERSPAVIRSADLFSKQARETNTPYHSFSDKVEMISLESNQPDGLSALSLYKCNHYSAFTK